MMMADRTRYGPMPPQQPQPPQPPMSPAPPYLASSGIQPDQPVYFQQQQLALAKPEGGVPMATQYVGNGINMPVEGPPPVPEKQICGMRRKVFFVALGAMILLFVAGLGTGLGIALGRRQSEATGVSGGNVPASGSSSSSSSSSTSDYVTTSSDPAPGPGLNLPPTTTPPSSTSTSTSTSTSSTTTRRPTGLFQLEAGYSTISATYSGSSGDASLCSLFYYRTEVLLRTTVYVTVSGSADQYSASWSARSSTQFTAIGSPQPATATEYYWSFGSSWRRPGSCSIAARDVVFLEANNVASYGYRWIVTEDCVFGGTFLFEDDVCVLWWEGVYY